MIYLVEWNDDLMLGVKMMDEHHEELINILNRCYRALMLHDHQHELETIMNELCDYTHYHFETEKRLMNDLGYAESASHLSAHEKFTDMIARFQGRAQSGESFVAMEVLQFLQKWLVAHIKKTDRAFAEFIKEKNAA
jgi:hemerythrin